MRRDEKDAGDQRIARRFLADTRNRGLILEHVKFFYLESIHWRLLRVAATLEFGGRGWAVTDLFARIDAARFGRSEEHTSELQSLMRISYAVFCLKKKKETKT